MNAKCTRRTSLGHQSIFKLVKTPLPCHQNTFQALCRHLALYISMNVGFFLVIYCTEHNGTNQTLAALAKPCSPTLFENMKNNENL